MSMDIASSAPSAPSTATGGPPGAGPPTPASGTQEFAALLTRQGAPPAKRAPRAGPKSPGEGPDTAKAASPSDPNTADPTAGEQARETGPGKHGAKDAIDTSADLGVSLLVQTVPPEAVALAVPVHAGMPFPLPSGADAAGHAIPGAMDTSLASAPATRGATPLQSGGELLPHTDIPAAVAASATPGPFALPAPAQAPATVPAPGAKASTGQAGQVGTAQGAAGVLLLPGGAGAGNMSAAHAATAQASPAATAQASPAPASSPATPLDASASTKLAVQEYAQLGQAALQKSARPANNTSIGTGNTSIGTGAAALQAAQGPGKGGVQASLAQGTAGTANPAPAEKTAGQAGVRSAGAGTSADSSQAGQQTGAGLFPLPAPAQVEGAKPAAAPLAPQTPADRAALMQQAADSVRALHTQVLGHGRGQMTLQLHPQDWGKLQVSVSMTPAGTAGGGTTVVAHVVADSAAVKQALESGGADLHRTLREAGLHLERLTITIRPGGASTEAQGMGAQAGGGRNPSPDPQASATPGSRSDANTEGMPGAGGQALSGGGGGQAGSRSPERGQAMRLDPRAPDDHQGDVRIAAPAMHAAGRLDTRA